MWHRAGSSAAVLAIALAGIARAQETAPAAQVPVNTTLMWEPVAGASGYEVYFGADAPAYQCRVNKPEFLLETLSAGKTYRWRADAIVNGTAVKGAERALTTRRNPTREEMYGWSIRIADSFRALYPQPQVLRGWNYTEGMCVDALYAIATRTGRQQDIVFGRQWLDRFVRADGSIDPQAYPLELYSLDRVRPGPALLWYYQRTGEDKYLKAARLLIRQLEEQPRTRDGGYWHRSTYPNQMWLDGIYMADVFAVQYAAVTGETKYYDEAVKQIMLIHRHTHDPKTGLYYHGWDETRSRPWADRETGTSPEFWGRALGWYAMALADVLDWLPADHAGRGQILPVYKALCASLLKYQDGPTAMWWQIMDKPTGPKNYVETSCSIMFAYAMARGAQRGWLEPEYLEHARRATRGILNHKISPLEAGRFDIEGTVTVGSLGGNGGFYDYYVNVGLTKNDLKGVGAFMYLSMVLSETANDTGPASREFPKRQP